VAVEAENYGPKDVADYNGALQIEGNHTLSTNLSIKAEPPIEVFAKYRSV
jgi:hypothetical protein